MPRRREETLLHLWRIVALGSFPSFAVTFCHPGPGDGLHTRHLPEIVGKSASRDIERGTPLSWDLVAKA